MARRQDLTDGDGTTHAIRSKTLLAKMAATIAAGVEANQNIDWNAEQVAARSVEVAQAIVAQLESRGLP